MRKIFALFLLFAVGQASAATMYSYTGNNFDSFGSYSVVPNPPEYDNTMSVSGWFIVEDELISDGSGFGGFANYVDISSSVLEYSFSDGINTLTHANSFISDFIITYDTVGDFVSWEISVGQQNYTSFSDYVPETAYWIRTQDDYYSDTVDQASSFHCSAVQYPYSPNDATCSDVHYDTGASITDNSGTWVKSSVNVVPVPAAVWLFGSALAGLGWLRRKQSL